MSEPGQSIDDDRSIDHIDLQQKDLSNSSQIRYSDQSESQDIDRQGDQSHSLSDNQQNDEDQNDDENQDQNDDQYHQKHQSHPQQELESSILQQIHPSQLKGIFRDKICEDIEQKMYQLEDDIENKSQEQMIEIRTIQLAKTKILVMVHDWSAFRLVIGYTRLAIAYMDFDCYDQALEHLNTAIKRNKQFLEDIPKTRIYHSYVLTSLSKCYYEKHDYNMALDFLVKARQIEMQYPKQQISSLKTLMLMSNCYSKLKDYDNANATIDQLIQLLKQENISEDSPQCAMAFIQKAKIKSLEQAYTQAEQYQNKGIQIMIDINYKRPQFVAQACHILANYQQKLKNVEDQINSLRKAKTIFQQIYSKTDKKVIKLKREIAVVLLKNQNHDQSLIQLEQTLQLQRVVYGEKSIQVGKTLKLIGTIYQSIQKINQSKQYLSLAQKILNQKNSKLIVTNNNMSKEQTSKTKLRFVKEIRHNRKIIPKGIFKKV